MGRRDDSDHDLDFRQPLPWWTPLAIAGGLTLLALLGVGLAVWATRAGEDGEGPRGGGASGAATVPLQTFAVERPESPVTFRLRAELSTLYDGPYEDCADSHLAVRLFEPSTFHSLQAYVPRDSALGQRVLAALRGGPRPATVTLRAVRPDGTRLQPGDAEVAALEAFSP